jgi:D-alanine-D-alanine ligase
MKPLTVAVLYGGRSVEHEVSLKSAMNVCNRLTEVGHEVVPILITRSGLWYLQDTVGSARQGQKIHFFAGHKPTLFTEDGTALQFDAAFPLVHGTNGEDGVLQGLLDGLGLPYVGCKVAASVLGMHKHLAKGLVGSQGVPVTPSRLFTAAHVRRIKENGAMAKTAAGLLDEFGNSIVLKPDDGGSSVGVVIVHHCTADCLEQAFGEVLRYTTECLVEPYVADMVEIECALIEDNGELVASPCGAVLDPGKHVDGFLSYDRKYDATNCATMQIPAPIIAEHAQAIRQYALTIGRILGVQGFARVDFFYIPATGAILFNEINTIPGMTATSHYPRLIAQAGYDWQRLSSCLLGGALGDHALRMSLSLERLGGS